jgi:hypothetical protein
MMWAYELSDQEYRTIVDALEYAEDNAVHSDAKARFSGTRHTMMEEHARISERTEDAEQ